MSLFTLAVGFRHLRRGKPDGVSKIGIEFVLADGCNIQPRRTFLRHRMEYGLTRAEWRLFKDVISAFDGFCNEHNLR